jgi:hypothetical protein
MFDPSAMCEARFGNVNRETQRALQGEARWRCEAGAQAALPVAADDGVDGQRDSVEPGRFSGRNQRAVKSRVLVDVELEQLGRGHRAADLLEADRAERRDTEERAELFRRAPDRPLALPVEQPLQRRR